MQTQEIDEIEELWKELERKPSPEDNKKVVEDRLKEIEDEQNSTMLYDPVENDYPLTPTAKRNTDKTSPTRCSVPKRKITDALPQMIMPS
jgi:hypothetical protein